MNVAFQMGNTAGPRGSGRVHQYKERSEKDKTRGKIKNNCYNWLLRNALKNNQKNFRGKELNLHFHKSGQTFLSNTFLFTIIEAELRL